MATHPIRLYREREGISRAELARRIGVDPQTIYRWENGKRWPRRDAMRRIERVTGISITELSVASAGAAQ